VSTTLALLLAVRIHMLGGLVLRTRAVPHRLGPKIIKFQDPYICQLLTSAEAQCFFPSARTEI